MHPFRELARLASPMLIAQLAVMANAVADTMLTGHYDPTHLAAVGLGASVYFTVFVALTGSLQALAPLVARRFGAGDWRGIGTLVRQGILIGLALSIPGVLLLAQPQPILAWVDAPPEVATLLGRYLQAVAVGLPAVMLTRVFIALAPSVGHPREVMLLNLASLAAKVPLTWALIHGWGPFPELGGPGCGVASSAIAWVAAIGTWLRVRRGAAYAAYGVFRGSFAPDRKVIGEILHLGIPIGLTFLVDVSAYTFMALFLARLGATVSGAHQIAANLGAVAFMVPLSIGTGAQILVGHALGAGDRAKARRLAWLGVRVGLALALGVAALLLFGRGPIVALYTSDPEVAALAVSLLPLLALYHFGDALQGVIAQVLRAYRRAVMPMVAFIVTMWGVGLGAGWWLAFRGFGVDGSGSIPLGAAGFWWAEAAGVSALGLLLAAYLARVVRAAPKRYS